MFTTWNHLHDAQDAPDHRASVASPGYSPSTKRRRMSEMNHGRRISKVTRACDACKVRKAKCSGTKPCTSCASKKTECSYEVQYLRGRPPTPPVSTPGTNVTGHSIQTGAHDKSADPNGARSGAQLSTEVPSRTFSRSSPELDAAEINGQYVDPTSGLSFLQRARQRLKQRNTAQAAQHVGGSTQPLTAAGDKPLMIPASNTAIHVVATDAVPEQFPDSTLAVELLDLYFDVCVATYKPLHRPTVDMWYSMAASNIEKGYDISFGLGNARFSTLLSIFAVATFHSRKSLGYSDDSSSLSVSDALFHWGMRLTETETGVPHLESAQARLLQVFYLLMTSRMNQAWYIFGNLLQIISALGMHRRDRKRNISSSPLDYVYSQCRKRTFWSAYILDKYLGVVMGRPRHFHDNDIDQDYPDRVNDSEMATPALVGGESVDNCLIDGFVCNVKLSRIVGEISNELYSINPLPEARREAVHHKLETDLQRWLNSLPAFLGNEVKPSTLIRSFRRQSIALRLAYNHALMHLHRPALLRRSQTASNDIHTSQRDSIRHCITAAHNALQIVDSIAREGPLFHAFWWTHYVAFCALAVIYVWNMQSHEGIQGIDRESLIVLADQCQSYLAQATATNSPSRRYSIILEELKYESAGFRAAGVCNGDDIASGSSSLDTSAQAATDSLGSRVLDQSGAEGSYIPEVTEPFWDWQTSDWLDLDAFAFGTVSLSPDALWLGSL